MDVTDARPSAAAFVVPGFIDVHAHWGGFDSLYPAKSWELETFLAYGVTTLHNPSADTVDGAVERSRVESGQLIGPRIFQVGTIIYGAGNQHTIIDLRRGALDLLLNRCTISSGYYRHGRSVFCPSED